MELKKFFSTEATIGAVLTLAAGVGGSYLVWGGAAIEQAVTSYLHARCTTEGQAMAADTFQGPIQDGKGNMLLVVCADHPEKDAIYSLARKTAVPDE